MLNKVMIIGKLWRDPELNRTPAGTPVCTLDIATGDFRANRGGGRADRFEWHRAVVFQKTAESCSQHLSKGSLVYVEGKLVTRRWQDPQGREHHASEIRAQRVQFLDAAQRAPAPLHRPDGTGRPPFPYEASAMDNLPF